MPKRATSRRDFIRSFGAGAALLLLATPPASAAPLTVNLTTTKRSNNVRVRVTLSVNMPPVAVNNHYLGTYYVPYVGEKVVNGGIMAGVFYVLRMSIQNQQRDLKFFAEVSAGLQKTSTTIIKNLQ